MRTQTNAVRKSVRGYNTLVSVTGDIGQSTSLELVASYWYVRLKRHGAFCALHIRLGHMAIELQRHQENC